MDSVKVVNTHGPKRHPMDQNNHWNSSYISINKLKTVQLIFRVLTDKTCRHTFFEHFILYLNLLFCVPYFTVCLGQRSLEQTNMTSGCWVEL